MNITVYLGANEGNDPVLREDVRKFGVWIGASGNTLVYGGSKTGPMGKLAKSALDAGRKVIGVEPQFLFDRNFQYGRLTNLIVTKNIAERKNKMLELGDAFVALPGGTGTLEEISEIMARISLKQMDAPCIIWNYDGFYLGLKALLNHMAEMGLSSKKRQQGVYFVESLEQITRILSRTS